LTEEVEVAQEATAEPQEVEQVEQVENTEESTPSDTEDTGEPKRQDKGVGKRINELTREKYEAKREAEYWRQQAELMRQPQAEKSSGKPTPDQFQTFEDYQEALVNHALSERLAKEREAKEAFEAEQRTRAAKQTWSKQEETAREAFIDYDETVYPLLDIEEVVTTRSSVLQLLIRLLAQRFYITSARIQMKQCVLHDFLQQLQRERLGNWKQGWKSKPSPNPAHHPHPNQ